jgi:hypothetical protein
MNVFFTVFVLFVLAVYLVVRRLGRGPGEVPASTSYRSALSSFAIAVDDSRSRDHRSSDDASSCETSGGWGADACGDSGGGGCGGGGGD